MLLFALCFPCCDVPDFSRLDEPNKIVLKWNKGYETQTRSDVMRGMIWSFSWMGAELPDSCYFHAVHPLDSVTFEVNLDSLGFNETASEALLIICDSIRRTPEYTARGSIDIGEFMMLTLGSTWHYYAITGVPKTLEEFKAKYQLDNHPFVFGVTKSSIAEGHRKILFSRDTALFHCGFMAVEGEGSLIDGTFTETLYECFDIMPNGQLRFMIYGKNGNLISGSPQAVGDAGKPTKCLWCHETSIQSLFIDNTPVNGMLTNEEFLLLRDSMQASLQRYRLALKSEMNFENHPEHTLGELLYITYMEPTLMHIANEWDTTEAAAQVILQHKRSTVFEEFDYIGRVYSRTDVNSLDSITNIEVPASARETGEEVDFLH